jgi:hypothetical protein
MLSPTVTRKLSALLCAAFFSLRRFKHDDCDCIDVHGAASKVSRMEEHGDSLKFWVSA